MARSDMSDLEWDFIKAVLPNKARGVKRVDDRRVINRIFYVLRTGHPLGRPARAIRPAHDDLQPLQSVDLRRPLGSGHGSSG